MSHPLLIRLDQCKNRLARRAVAPAEVNAALRPRWVRYHLERQRESNWGPPMDEPDLDRLIDAVVQPGGTGSQRQADGLLALGRALGSEQLAEFRRSPARPLSDSHPPPPPEMVETALRRFFEWVGAAGFAEIHPIVQMSLCQARLMEIQPFERPAEALVCAHSAGFALAAGFLLPIPDPGSAPRFPAVLEEAFQLSTGPLVEFNLESALRAYSLADALLGGDVTHPGL